MRLGLCIEYSDNTMRFLMLPDKSFCLFLSCHFMIYLCTNILFYRMKSKYSRAVQRVMRSAAMSGRPVNMAAMSAKRSASSVVR